MTINAIEVGPGTVIFVSMPTGTPEAVMQRIKSILEDTVSVRGAAYVLLPFPVDIATASRVDVAWLAAEVERAMKPAKPLSHERDTLPGDDQAWTSGPG